MKAKCVKCGNKFNAADIIPDGSNPPIVTDGSFKRGICMDCQSKKE